MDNIGKRLDGRYELLELIGVGGMADIFKAKDIIEDKIVAVKILKNELSASEDFIRRFRNESKAIALLSHPNIVKIFDVGLTDKIQFIVMEYIDGINLTEYIEQQGVIKWKDAIHFSIQILRALQHAHDRGIVHRDIKSQNIMLLQDGTIKVMDFGIARFNRDNSQTIAEKAIGSVHYISPEQARGDITDEKSDIYSVGVMLYEMLTGKKPFDGDNPVSIALMHMQNEAKKPTSINTTIPEGLEEITLKAMQKEPSKRYQTAAEMIKDIEEFKKNPSIVFEYKYFSTDGTTKYFDKLSKLPEKDTMVTEDEYDDDDDDYEEDEPRSPLLAILFAVASGFVIITAVFIVTIILNGTIPNSDEGNDEHEMPNIVGSNYIDVYAEYDFITFNVTAEYSSYEKDIIFYQSITAGRPVKYGTPCDIKVSKGIQEVEIQDYTNRPQDEVISMLEKAGLKYQLSYRTDQEITENFVIKTEPAARTFVEVGSTVTVIVSVGPVDEKVIVPDFVGMKQNLAVSVCEEYKLIPTFIKQDSLEEEGKILSQSIDPTKLVAQNSTIELYVSSGEIPEQETVVTINLPSSATGEFKFKYYVDGVLIDEETRDVGLSASKSIKRTIKGKEKVMYSINVESVVTGKSGTFIEVEVDFEQTPAKKTETFISKSIFTELSKQETTAPPEPEPTEAETVTEIIEETEVTEETTVEGVSTIETIEESNFESSVEE